MDNFNQVVFKESITNVESNDFIDDLRSLFTKMNEKALSGNYDFSQFSEIEAFKKNHLTIDFEKANFPEFKSNTIKVLLENYILFNESSNSEIYFNILLDLIEIIFKLYSCVDFKYVLDKEDFAIFKMKENKSVFENFTVPEKYFIYLGLNLKDKEIINESFVQDILDYKNSVPNSYKNILIFLYDQKKFLNHNLILDLLILELINNIDSKLITIYLPRLILLDVQDSIICFKIIVINLIVYSRIKQTNPRIFNNILSNIVKLISNESQALSRRMNDILYNNNFSDFEFNVELGKKKLKHQEYNFLIDNLFPLLIYLIKFFLSNNMEKDKEEFFYYDPSNSSIHEIFKDNFSAINIIDLTNAQVLETFYFLLEQKLEDNKEDSNKFRNPNCFNKIKNQSLENKIQISYFILAFSLDIVEFLYDKFHILPESFKENSDLNIKVNPFSVYESNNTPYAFEKFIFLIMDIFDNSVSNYAEFVRFYIIHQEIKSKFLNKIKDLNENSDSLYEIYEPMNHLGLSILIWLFWREQKKSLDFTTISEPTARKKKKFFNLALSKIKLFDSLLPVIAYLIKRSQNYKYMGFEMLFDSLDFIEPETISEMKMLKNYSYEDIYKDLLEYIGGPDPQLKRMHIAKNFNRLIYIFSDEMKKNILIYILKENLKENTPINDQMNSFILHCLRNLLNEHCEQISIKNYSPEKNNLNLLDERFLKEIISLTFTAKLFVIDILEVICQSVNFIQFCILKDKLVFKGQLKIYEKSYLNYLEKEVEKILYFIKKWNGSSDEEKMKQMKVDTSDFHTITDFSEKKRELLNNFEKRKNQGLITQNLLNHLDSFIFKCKKEL